jgi:hypothetical protein
MRPAAKRALAGIVLALGCGAQPAAAGTGNKITLPTAPKPHANGLRLALDSRWVQGYGYRPVVIEVTCAPPAVADRTLSIELAMASWTPGQRFVTVTTEIEITAGASSVSKVIPVPQLTDAQYLALNVSEDGRLIEEFSLDNLGLIGSGHWAGDAEPVRILFVAANPPDVSQFGFLVSNSYGQTGAIGRPADVMSFEHRAPADLVENWINYSGLDAAFVSLDDARELAAKRPAVWQALTRWTRCGGSLCVFGVGDNWNGLAELEQLLGIPAGEKDAAKTYRGWEAASGTVFEQQVIPAAQSFDAQQASITGGAATPGIPPGTTPKAPAAPPFVWKPAAFGLVVAMSDSNPFPGESLGWRWLLESIGPDRTRWPMRHGTVPDQENAQFNNFLISDVGLPPIRTYRVLITLFVVAIGPVNYWLLRRGGRLHLFLFTVPAAALVTSGGLLAYALVADGLESRLRARSLIYLDQSRGEAVSHARLSYYTGLAPSGGLVFSDQTAIFPLELNPSAGPLRGRSRQVDWGDEQHLARGWLGSRMPTQYVTVRADKTKQALVLVPGGDPRMTVQNGLGAAVESLLCCDGAGKLHLGEKLADGATATLAPIDGRADIDAVLLTFSLALSRHAPAFPNTISAFDSTGWFFPARRRHWYYNQQSSADTTRSLLERELARIKAAVLSQTLEPGTYVAIVARPPEIETGTDGLTESQSLHVICGRW